MVAISIYQLQATIIDNQWRPLAQIRNPRARGDACHSLLALYKSKRQAFNLLSRICPTTSLCSNYAHCLSTTHAISDVRGPRVEINLIWLYRQNYDPEWNSRRCGRSIAYYGGHSTRIHAFYSLCCCAHVEHLSQEKLRRKLKETFSAKILS